MKKLAFMLFVAVLSIAFVACGDSQDFGESTQKSTQDSQVESSNLSQDSIQSNA